MLTAVLEAKLFHQLSPLPTKKIMSPFSKSRSVFAFLLMLAPAFAQQQASLPLDGADGRNLALNQFRPKPMLQVARTKINGAKFPVIDVHSHLSFRLKNSTEQLDDFVNLMDRHNIAMCISLDAKLGSTLDEHKAYLWTKYRDRFAIFVHLDWLGDGQQDKPETWASHRPEFGRRVALQLAEAKAQGACGLKIFKRFGLSYKNPDGSLIRIDDPRWDPIWAACGELGFPVIIHTADPAAFFLPIDKTNERWEELHRHPEWSFPADKYPSRSELLLARNRVIAKHPKTSFIGAHGANNSEDLATVEKWLEQYPNLYVEFASRIGELGRQPYTARRFLIQHSDRVLYGTDGPWPEARIFQYWRFFETFDENFPYSEKEFPPQGFWNIYGVGLPDNVLKKIYHENALELLPSLREKFARFRARK